MKKIIGTLILSGCITLVINAQFLMNSNSHIMRSGDEHYFNITNNVEPGAAGAAVFWDFSKLETHSTLTSYIYGAYSTGQSAEIPEANTVLEEFNTKFYFKASEGIIEQYGTVTKNTISKFDKPFVKMVFPFNYGDKYSGDFSGTVYGNNNYEAKFTGTYLLEADAYGTILLPGNITYENVFRIKTIKEQCYNGNNSCNCASISYKWYSAGVRYPLLTIIQSQSSKGTKTIRTAYYSKTEYKIIDNDNINKLVSGSIEAHIYPNPFMGEFKLDYTLLYDSDVTIEIYDNSGRKVNSVEKMGQKAGYYSETIHGSELQGQLGMFHIRIIAGEEVVSKTIIRSE